jgi:putative flippase GtrA
MLTLVLAWNFYANRKFVFPSSHGDGATAQALRFAAASSGFRFLEYLLVTLLMLDWLRLPYALAITLGTGGMLGLKYVVFTRFVFRPRATRAESLSCRP